MAAKDVRKRYRDRGVARAYGESFENSLSGRIRHIWFKSRLRRGLRRHVAGRRFLDIPSGNGRLIGTIQSMMPSLHVGADISFEMLQMAKRRGLPHAVQCDVLHLPFRDGAFDVSVCARFLHHLGNEERPNAVKEILRVSEVSVLFYDSLYAIKQISRLLRSFGGQSRRKAKGLPLSRISADIAHAGKATLARWWIFIPFSAQLAVVAGPAIRKDGPGRHVLSIACIAGLGLGAGLLAHAWLAGLLAGSVASTLWHLWGWSGGIGNTSGEARG